MIFVGGGANEAAAEVRALAERLTAPVVAYRRGKGVLDERHPLSHVLPGGHALWAKADVVLAVGTRLQMPISAWGIDDKLKIIKIDVDPAEIERLRKPEIGIVGRLGDACCGGSPNIWHSSRRCARTASRRAARSRSRSPPISRCSRRSSAICARSATCCRTTAW